MSIDKTLIEEFLLEVSKNKGWKTATTTKSVDVSGPGGSRNRGSMAKSYPIGSMIKDPDERPELQEEAEPDVDIDKLNALADKKDCAVEDLGYSEDGFKLQNRYEFQDLPISVEQKKGSEREWTDRNGETGTTKMQHDYGYVEGSLGYDGDAVDVYVGPNEDAEWVYVIHQNSVPDFTEYDEDKCMLGFDSAEEAKEAYLKHYNDERFFGGMSTMSLEDFKSKVFAGEQKKLTNESRKRSSKGISHISDLDEKKFWEFVEAIREGHASITEKLDGSAFMEFGISENGGLWAKSKNSRVMENSRSWPKSYHFRAHQRAHESLELAATSIHENWPKGLQSLTCEILDGPVPNVLEYGPNAIVLHMNTPNSRKLTESVKLEGWRFECAPVIETLYASKDMTRNGITESLMSRLRDYKPHFGGQVAEGFVIKNNLTNEMCKVVNKNLFTELNSFCWKFRELQENGTKLDERWTPGLRAIFRKEIAERVVGSPTIKSAGFSKYIKRKYNEGSIERSLESWIRDKNLFHENSGKEFGKIVEYIAEMYNYLYEGWKSSPRTLKTENRIFEMHPIIEERIEEDFRVTKEWILRMTKKKNATKLGIIKMAMGENRWNKLKEDVELDPSHAGQAEELLLKNAELLKRHKGVDVGSAKQLGAGTQGTAFDIGGGKVLKVTKDKKEAVASQKVLGKNLEFVVRIFDVFRFKDTNAFGIIQEKLTPLSEGEKKEYNDYIIYTALPIWLKRATSWDDALDQAFKFVVKKRGDGEMKSEKSKAAMQKADKIIDILEQRWSMKDMWEELKAEGIKYSDFQGDNLMKRGGKYVLIDLGLSETTGGADPDVLESIIREIVSSFFLSEDSVADTIGVTIGRFQPFHKGHAQIIRQLANDFTKVIVIVAGNKQDENNPFSFERRVEMMKKSLPDIEPKIEVHIAEWKGKPNGYLPGILNDIIQDNNSSIEKDSAINVLVGPDRFDGMKKQIENSKDHLEELPYLNPDLVVVNKLPGVKNDMDDMDRISGSELREALAKNDKNKVASLLDPHIVSNPQEFDELYSNLREEMKTFMKIEEDSENNPMVYGDSQASRPSLKTVGAKNIVMTLVMNAKKLKQDKNIDVSKGNIKTLGHGQMGIAFDIGGSKVLKVTTDAREAKACNVLKNKSYTNIVKVYDVWRFGKTPDVNGELFGIVTEFLQELSETEKKEVKIAFDFIRDDAAGENVFHTLYTGTWDELPEVLWAEMVKDGFKDIKGVDGEETPFIRKQKKRVKQKVRKEYDEIMGYLKKYDVPAMINNLRDAGIQFGDFHQENLMKRGSTYVINDIGMSKTNGPDPDVFETVINSVAEAVIKEFGMSLNPGGTHAAAGGAQSSPWSNAQGIRYKKDKFPYEEELEERKTRVGKMGSKK